MLAACLEDGLTVGNQVFKKGDVFVLGGEVAGDAENTSDERMARKQTRIYGKPMYRKATPEEIINVVLHAPKKVSTKDLTESERALCARYVEGRKAKEASSREFLIKEKEKLAQEDEFVDKVADDVDETPDADEAPDVDEGVTGQPEKETAVVKPVESTKSTKTRTSRKKPK